jgi:hypothetical protein
MGERREGDKRKKGMNEITRLKDDSTKTVIALKRL